jgi:DNA-binding HxlR family transcriptional regulator
LNLPEQCVDHADHRWGEDMGDRETRALSLVGERWALLIVREAFDGVRRFQDFRTRLGIAGNLLSIRLDALVRAGILQRIPHHEPGGRRWEEYQLTDRGTDLRPVLHALSEWAGKHVPDRVAGDDIPPISAQGRAG